MQIDFTNLKYLENGNPKQQKVFQLLNQFQIFEKLKSFHPILVGTIPINIDTENSDLDIICEFQDENNFKEIIQSLFENYKNFKIKETNKFSEKAIVSSFEMEGFQFEIFGQKIPTVQQFGYLHMLVEARILQEKGEDFRQKVIDLKKKGLKTEPAFAKLLNIEGDPFQELLKY
ncbi:DUF4269 domain-containing protein [Aureivirga sp. CE67]|uniref:DUF4269 domain-containing protein n=1 Tax=Aureivirga sp. CE67 TaxID=1788983 RepID=UPI0018CB0A7A|nr:DUF4269 domain-containing protein [Aureivirga sp. CE67]